MKRLVPLVLLSLVACGRTETIGSELVISDKPPRVVGTESELQVPDVCPLYIPGGGDQDTVEAPLPSGSTGLCAVDDQGRGGCFGQVGRSVQPGDLRQLADSGRVRYRRRWQQC